MAVIYEQETENECFRKLISLIWPEGYRCRRCGSTSYWSKGNRRLLICKDCRIERSPLANTMFSRSHIPLLKWFEIMRVITNSPDRVVTAASVFDEIGLGSYRTAWEALRKIRYVISRNEPRAQLTGNVEFDELVFSGESTDYSKISILGALEISGDKRLSLQMIKNPDEMNIKDYFKGRFSRKAQLIVDPKKLYIQNWLALNRIKQISANQIYGYHFMNLHIILQDIKYGIRNGHHGISEKALQENLDEYVYIFNHNDDREQAFEILLKYMVTTPIKEYRLSGKQNRSILSIIRGSN